ncbi:MAG: type II toxin-antitoxin system RelE/ParE family toxin [Gemmataceae bacterium]
MASVRLLLRAEADLEEAVAWYEARSARVARRFEASVASALERISAMPALYALMDDRHRVCPIAKSQYLLVYRHDAAADEVTVVAVAHASQDPPPWQTSP